MESLAKVATAIGQPDLNQKILQSITIKDGNSQVNVANVKEDWVSLRQEGNKHYKEERWEEAISYFTRAIHLNQGEAVLYSNRALCELRLSKFDLAREDIEDAIQLDPKNVKYYRILSEVLLRMKIHEESLEACLQGLTINPRDEVLILRERDCRALIASDQTDKNPVLGKYFVEASLTEKNEKIRKMLNHLKNLQVTSDDIEDISDSDILVERQKLSSSIIKAHQYLHGTLSATLDNQLKAFNIFEAAAKKESADGLYNVARFYSQGKAGLPRDFNKAIELCRKAASQKPFIRYKETLTENVGVAAAEAFLGNCYRDGRGVDQCSTEAFKW